MPHRTPHRPAAAAAPYTPPPRPRHPAGLVALYSQLESARSLAAAGDFRAGRASYASVEAGLRSAAAAAAHDPSATQAWAALLGQLREERELLAAFESECAELEALAAEQVRGRARLHLLCCPLVCKLGILSTHPANHLPPAHPSAHPPAAATAAGPALRSSLHRPPCISRPGLPRRPALLPVPGAAATPAAARRSACAAARPRCVARRRPSRRHAPTGVRLQGTRRQLAGAGGGVRACAAGEPHPERRLRWEWAVKGGHLLSEADARLVHILYAQHLACSAAQTNPVWLLPCTAAVKRGGPLSSAKPRVNTGAKRAPPGGSMDPKCAILDLMLDRFSGADQASWVVVAVCGVVV